MGAGAVVTKDVPAGARVVGNPARLFASQRLSRGPEARSGALQQAVDAVHHLHAGVFHGLELLDHPFDIPLLARVQGGLAASWTRLWGPSSSRKPDLGEELGPCPSKYHLPSLH